MSIESVINPGSLVKAVCLLLVFCLIEAGSFSKSGTVYTIKHDLKLKEEVRGKAGIYKVETKKHCALVCHQQDKCTFGQVDLTTMLCTIYHNQLLFDLTMLEPTEEPHRIYAKDDYLSIAESLTNRWSFEMDFVDETPDNNGTMFDPVNFRLQTTDDSQKDRFGKANSTLYLNQGYAKVPPGEYMSGDFTMSLWINIRECNSYQKIFYMQDTDAPDDGIFFASCHETNPTPYFVYGSGTQRSTLSLPIKQWSHLVFLMQGNQLRIYIDGQQAYSGSSTPIVAKHHPIVTLGASNPSHSTRGNTVFDDFMIFDRALTMDEITQVSYIN